MAKRGRRKSHNDYNFSFIIDECENLNENPKSVSDDEYEIVISKILEYYRSKDTLIDVPDSNFHNYCCFIKDQYNSYTELCFYFYLKREMENHFSIKKKRIYFGDEEEYAFKVFLKEKKLERKEIIYNKFLKHPIEKLTESLIHKYKLYSSEYSYDDLHTDAISFLHDKMLNFNPDLNTKAYSYLGTILKNYFIVKQKNESDNKKRVHNYEDAYEYFADDEKHSYSVTVDEGSFPVSFFYEMSEIIEGYINKEDSPLSENEINLGKALVVLLDKWEDIFDNNGVYSNKFRKNSVFEILRNLTGQTSQQITQGMKIFKQLYFLEKQKRANEEYNPFDDIK